MKKSVYKKVDGKIEKVNKNNTLQDFFIMAYNILLNEIKAKKHVFTLDNLQDAILSIWTRLNDINEVHCYQDALKYLKRSCFYRQVDSFRESNNFELLKEEYCDLVIDNIEYGITETFIVDIVKHIKDILSDSQYELFNLKYLLGLTQNEIAEKLNLSQSEISKQLNRIENIVDNLNIRYFYDSRYATYQSKKHRKYLRFQESKEENGSTYKVDTSSYIPQSKCQFEAIPINKALQYPTLQFYKRDKGISYDSLHNGVMQYDYISSNLYNLSEVLPANKSKVLSKYRIKRLWRQFARCHSEIEVKKMRSKVVGE